MNRYVKLIIHSLIVTAAVFLTQPTAAYAYDDIAVGSQSVKYADPEFDSGTNMLTFRDAWLSANAWVGWLDPEDGTLVTETGKDFWLANQLSPINELQDNGPEWMRHNGVATVIYTRQEGKYIERMYLWSAATGQSTPVIPGTDYVIRSHCNGSNSVGGPGKILYRRRTSPITPWEVYWLDLSNPTQEFHLPDVELEVSLPTWISDDAILYSRHEGSAIQLVQYDTATHSETVLTSDGGDKLGAYAWNAPEAGGELLYMAPVKMGGDPYPRQIRIYQMLEGTAVTFATLTIPPEAGTHVNISSPEPFVYQGASYISLSLFTNGNTEGSIWVFGLPVERGGTPPPPQRVDDPNLVALKLDPEAYVTSSGAFVYYYYNPPGLILLRRCVFQPTGPELAAGSTLAMSHDE